MESKFARLLFCDHSRDLLSKIAFMLMTQTPVLFCASRLAGKYVDVANPELFTEPVKDPRERLMPLGVSQRNQGEEDRMMYVTKN